MIRGSWFRKPTWWFWMHLFLGVIVWFFVLTEYSWFGMLLDLVSPPILVWLGVKLWKRRADFGKWKVAVLASLVPTGALVLLYGWAVIISFPGNLLWFFETIQESPSNLAFSPSGWKLAHVHVRPVGAYQGGQGRAFVRVSWTAFPLLEKDVYFLPSYLEHVTLRWKDDNTLVVEDSSRANGVHKLITVRLDQDKAEPVEISFPFAVHGAIQREKEIKKIKASSPVHAVPLHPRSKDGGLVFYYEDLGVKKEMDVEDTDPVRVAKWYAKWLKENGWSVPADPENLVQDRGSERTICFRTRKNGQSGPDLYISISHFAVTDWTDVDVATYRLCD
jgi:hypothetical protein